MITVVTTHNLEIFRLFYTHKYHNMFTEKLYLYVDKEDSSEFRKIVDPEKTRVFDKNDFKRFYGDRHLNSLTTFSKVYFLNFLFRTNLLNGNDSFYFTDDDILLFNTTFNYLPAYTDAIHAKDMFLKISVYYQKWNAVNEFINKNYDSSNTLGVAATNFYFPKRMVNDLARVFTKAFDEFIEILYNDRNYIDKINSESRSNRNAAIAVFYIDTPFFNIVFQKLGKENYSVSQIYLSTYSDIRKIKEKLNTENIITIMETYFKSSDKKTFPKRQPLLHFSVSNKYPLMLECYNYINGNKMSCKNVNDILKENPRENKKLEKTISKNLF